MEHSNEQKLRAAIKAMIAARGDLPDRVIGVSVSRAEPELIAAWVADKLEAITRSLRPKAAEPSQMAFPFHDLSVQIRTRTGPVELRGATLGMLRQADIVLSKKKRAGIAAPRPNSIHGRIRREIELMEPYAYASRKITVEKVHALIASGVPAPVPKRSGMSDAMRRYWEGKSPEERSAIARRRNQKRKKATS